MQRMHVRNIQTVDPARMIEDAVGALRMNNAYREVSRVQKKVYAALGISTSVQGIHVVNILRVEYV